MEIDKKVNVSADHSEPAFLADGLTASHTEERFILDFRQTTPRFDQVEDTLQQSYTIKHRTVAMNPKLAKDVLRVLKDNIEKFEEEHGEIELPEREELETKGPETSEPESTGYIG